nr:NAD-dependent epimerase/dehydratase family protein [Kiritimatiellia bacterium]
MKTLCITGANGFIGSHVALQAAEKGYALRLLLRRDLRPELRDLGAQVFRGDVRNQADLAPFLEGADALLHVAGVNTPSSAQRENIFTSNVEGTKLILRAAKNAGVRRIVHTGSTAALGCAGRGKLNNEDTPFNLWNASTDYERSKYLGEKTALELFAQEDIPVLIAQPAAAVGPGDAKPTYTGKLILDYLNRALPGYFDTRHNYVDVRSVAAGHLLALEQGEPGQRYLLCGDDNLLLSEYFALLRELTGVPPPRLKLPLLAVFPLAYACQALFHLTGRDPFIRVSTAKRAWCNLYYSNQKAKDQLGYAPRPLKDALRDEIDW